MIQNVLLCRIKGLSILLLGDILSYGYHEYLSTYLLMDIGYTVLAFTDKEPGFGYYR